MAGSPRSGISGSVLAGIFTYFPGLIARETHLIKKIVQSKHTIQAPEATELKRLLADQLHKNFGLEPWLRNALFDYVMSA